MANYFNRYNLQKQISTSKSSCVFLAKDQLIDNIEVCVKRIEFIDKNYKCHYTETNNLTRMRHININMYLDIFTYEKKLYIVSHTIGGETLESFISNYSSSNINNSKKYLPEIDAKIIFSQLRDAIMYSHKNRNLAHLKLNLRNIYIDNNLSIKVSNFHLDSITYEPNNYSYDLRFNAPEVNKLILN